MRRLLALGLVIGLFGAPAAAWYKGSSGVVLGDAYFSAIGSDSNPCTLASPCQSVGKMASWLANAIATSPGPNHNYVILSDGGNGPLPIGNSTVVLNSTHTVNVGKSVTFNVYNGSQAAWSVGIDTAGTWSSLTLPNGSGTAGCRSNALVSFAPLTEGNAARYVGVAWINGHRVQETINPRSGNAWTQQTGTCTAGVGNCPNIGASVFVGATATFASGSANIAIDDVTKVGVAGDMIAFETANGGFGYAHPYWIISKNSGAGTIQIGNAPPAAGGTAVVATLNGSARVMDDVQTANTGDWINTIDTGKNQFTYAATSPASSYNQKDVKIELSTYYAGALAPVYSVAAGVVTMNSRTQFVNNIYPTQGYRVWNRFEDLGTGGYTGELYTDRTSVYIYYVPNAGETCASINQPGVSYIPGPLETLLRISSNVARDGSTNGSAVGNFIFKNILIEHTNTSVFTGEKTGNGAAGGFVSTDATGYVSQLAWAVMSIGGSNVLFDTVEIAHLGGNALGFGWGTNNSTVQNSLLHDAGGSLITGGLQVQQAQTCSANTDTGYCGWNSGPSTPSYNTGGAAANQDLTGASDASILITNNQAYDGGIITPRVACIQTNGMQNSQITYNTMHDCGVFGYTDVTNDNAASPYFHIISGVSKSGVNYYPFFKHTFSHNTVYNCGYETTLTGGSHSRRRDGE